MSIMKNAAMNTCEHVHISVEYLSRCGIDKLLSIHIGSTRRYCQTISQSYCVNLHSHNHCKKLLLFAPHPCQNIFSHLHFSYTGGCRVISYYGFILHFPDD